MRKPPNVCFRPAGQKSERGATQLLPKIKDKDCQKGIKTVAW